MPDPDIYPTIHAVVSEVLGRDGLDLRPETSAEEIEGWDSLSHIQIVVGLERAFAIRFNAAELIDYQNIGSLADGIQRKLAERRS